MCCLCPHYTGLYSAGQWREWGIRGGAGRGSGCSEGRIGGRSGDGSGGGLRCGSQGRSRGDWLSDNPGDLDCRLQGDYEGYSERHVRCYPGCDFRRYLRRHSQGDSRRNSQDNLQGNLDSDLRCRLQGDLRRCGASSDYLPAISESGVEDCAVWSGLSVFICAGLSGPCPTVHPWLLGCHSAFWSLISGLH